MATYNEYLDKETLINNPGIPDINKVKADDMNYIKYNLPHIGTSVDSSYRTNILLSKNLFNKNGGNKLSAYIPSGTGAIQSNASAVTIYCQCEPNTTYTIKKGTSDRFIIGTTATTPAIGVECTFIVRDDSATTKTITTGNNARYLCVYYSSSSENIDSSIMINEGSTALPYEPYITPSIVVDNEEIYNKSDIDNLLAFDERVDDRFYTKFLNTSSSSAFGITIKGSIDRQTYLVMGVNNAMGSVLSIITSSSSTTNVKNLGTVNLSVSRSGSNISVSGMGQYTYVSVIGYDDFTLYR